MGRALPESALQLLTQLYAASRKRHRIGVLVPWANTAVETELPQFGQHAAAWHYARLVPEDGSTALHDGFLQGLMTAVPGALHQLSKLKLDLLLLACTSAGFTQPPLGDGAASGQGTVPLRDAFTAVVESLRLLGSREVVLLTPYPARTTVREVEALAERGVSVLSHACLDQADDYGEIGPETVLQLLDELDQSALAAADAVLLSCTGWPTTSVILETEKRLNRPVVSSNLALAIAGLHWLL